MNIPHRDFLLDVIMGRMEGYTPAFAVGVTPNLDAVDGTVTLWDGADYGAAGGGIVVPLTVGTNLYISSSSAADTAVTVLVEGLDANHVEQVLTVAVNGQTQVLIGNFIHVQVATVVAGNPAGDLYIATSTALTGGVPNTKTTIKSKVIQGKNITHNCFYMVPAGKGAIIMSIRGSTNSNRDALVTTHLTYLNQPKVEFISYDIASWVQWGSPTPIATRDAAGNRFIIIPEKSFLEYRVSVEDNNTRTFFSFDMVLVDNQQFNIAEV
tara:strand:+ start:12859 stop:13659 length:801 start_codon:yes stop_codon:yes gene_type:complete